MTDFPLVSILIPVYNREKIIIDTLSSAANQTYKNTEIIVVDNIEYRYYLENWSFFFDLKILFLTLFGRKTHKKAY